MERRDFLKRAAAAVAAGAAISVGGIPWRIRKANATPPTTIVMRSQSVLYPGRRFVVVVDGDSISAWSSPTGTFTSKLANDVSAAQILATGQPPIPYSRYKIAGVYPTSAHDWTVPAVSGDDCTMWCGHPFSDATLTAHVQARIVPYQPDVVILELGRNCIVRYLSLGYPDDTECSTNHAAFVTKVKALCAPGVQVLVCGPAWNNESWPTGANANDSAYDSRGAAIATACAAAGAVTFDFRTTIMAAEQVANPSKLNVGVMTIDGTHPNDVGKTYMRNSLFPLFTYA